MNISKAKERIVVLWLLVFAVGIPKTVFSATSASTTETSSSSTAQSATTSTSSTTSKPSLSDKFKAAAKQKAKEAADKLKEAKKKLQKIVTQLKDFFSTLPEKFKTAIDKDFDFEKATFKITTPIDFGDGDGPKEFGIVWNFGMAGTGMNDAQEEMIQPDGSTQATVIPGRLLSKGFGSGQGMIVPAMPASLKSVIGIAGKFLLPGKTINKWEDLIVAILPPAKDTLNNLLMLDPPKVFTLKLLLLVKTTARKPKAEQARYLANGMMMLLARLASTVDPEATKKLQDEWKQKQADLQAQAEALRQKQEQAKAAAAAAAQQAAEQAAEAQQSVSDVTQQATDVAAQTQAQAAETQASAQQSVEQAQATAQQSIPPAPAYPSTPDVSEVSSGPVSLADHVQSDMLLASCADLAQDYAAIIQKHEASRLLAMADEEPQTLTMPMEPNVPPAPAVPTAPTVPSVPTKLAAPAIPAAPTMPSVPVLPKAPAIPKAPALPKLPTALPKMPVVTLKPGDVLGKVLAQLKLDQFVKNLPPMQIAERKYWFYTLRPAGVGPTLMEIALGSALDLQYTDPLTMEKKRKGFARQVNDLTKFVTTGFIDVAAPEKGLQQLITPADDVFDRELLMRALAELISQVGRGLGKKDADKVLKVRADVLGNLVAECIKKMEVAGTYKVQAKNAKRPFQPDYLALAKSWQTYLDAVVDGKKLTKPTLTVPEVGAGDKYVTILEFVNIEFANLKNNALDRTFQGDKGYVNEGYLTIGITGLLTNVAAIGFKVINELDQAAKSFKKTDAGKAKYAELVGPAEAAMKKAQDDRAASLVAYNNQPSPVTKDLRKKAELTYMQAGVALMKAQAVFKKSALTFAYKRTKTMEPESLLAFAKRELVSLLRRLEVVRRAEGAAMTELKKAIELIRPIANQLGIPLPSSDELEAEAKADAAAEEAAMEADLQDSAFTEAFGAFGAEEAEEAKEEAAEAVAEPDVEMTEAGESVAGSVVEMKKATVASAPTDVGQMAVEETGAAPAPVAESDIEMVGAI